MFRKFSVLGILLCAIVLTGQGCMPWSSTDTNDNQPVQVDSVDTQSEAADDTQPQDNETEGERAEGRDLSENEKKMVGEWRLVGFEGGPAPGSMGNDVVEWTFRNDGTGIQYLNPQFGEEHRGEIKWELDEENYLYHIGAGQEYGEPQFQVVQFGGEEMRWENLILGGYFIFERK